MGAVAFDPSSAVPVGAAPSTAAPAAFDPSSAVPVNPSTSWGRAAGLDARSLLTGAAGLAAMPGMAMDNMKRSFAAAPEVISDLAHGDFSGATQDGKQVAAASQPGPYQGPQLSDFVHPERWQQAAQYFADKAGLPSPQTPGERVSSAAVSALPSAILSPEAPAAGMVAAAGGAAASQGVKEAGGSQGAQLAAGLLAGGLPAIGAGAAAVTRGLVRGTSGSAMRDTLDSFEQQGISPSVGQATGRPAIQAVERTVQRLPGGGSVMEHSAEAQRDALSDHVDSIVSNLTGGQNVTPTTAGEAITSGIQGAAKQMKADAGAAYDKVDQLVPPDTTAIPTQTGAALTRLTTPAPGAENLSAQLISPKVKALAGAFQADMEANGGKLPYSALADIKAKLGNQIDWSPFATDPENGQLKQVWQAVRGDMNDTASGVSPEAQQAVQDANSLYGANRAKQKVLEGVIGKAGGPEAVYNSLMNSGKQGATKIQAVLGSVDAPTRKLLAGAVIKRMGLAPAGLQSAAGDVFSPDSFLTNWNRMSPEAKDALFGSLPGDYSKSVTQLARNIERLKASGRVLTNPSGTGAALLHGAWWTELLGSVPMFFVAPHVAVGELASSLGQAGLTNVAARILTSPKAVRWLARETTLPRSLPPVLASQFAQAQRQKADQMTFRHFSNANGAPQRLTVNAIRPEQNGGPNVSAAYAADHPDQMVEPAHRGKPEYRITVPRSSMYDMSNDPEGIRDAATKSGVYNHAAAEQAVQQRGYTGYYTPAHANPLYRGQARFFKSVDATRKQ